MILNTVRAGADVLGHTRDRRRVNVSMTRARQGFVLVCDVNLFKLDQHIWGDYVRENESSIVSEKELEAYLTELGVETVRMREDTSRGSRASNA